jgi:hypothetical protein
VVGAENALRTGRDPVPYAERNVGWDMELASDFR